MRKKRSLFFVSIHFNFKRFKLTMEYSPILTLEERQKLINAVNPLIACVSPISGLPCYKCKKSISANGSFPEPCSGCQVPMCLWCQKQPQVSPPVCERYPHCRSCPVKWPNLPNSCPRCIRELIDGQSRSCSRCQKTHCPFCLISLDSMTPHARLICKSCFSVEDLRSYLPPGSCLTTELNKMTTCTQFCSLNALVPLPIILPPSSSSSSVSPDLKRKLPETQLNCFSDSVTIFLNDRSQRFIATTDLCLRQALVHMVELGHSCLSKDYSLSLEKLLLPSSCLDIPFSALSELFHCKSSWAVGPCLLVCTLDHLQKIGPNKKPISVFIHRHNEKLHLQSLDEYTRFSTLHSIALAFFKMRHHDSFLSLGPETTPLSPSKQLKDLISLFSPSDASPVIHLHL